MVRTVPWSIRDVALAILAVVMVAVALVLTSGWLLRWTGWRGTVSEFGYLAATEGILLLAAWWFGPRRHGLSWQAMGLGATLNKGLRTALLVFLASVGFSVIYGLIVSLFGIEGLLPSPLPSYLLDTLQERIAAFVLVVMMAPLAEESFFRGFMLPVLAKRWGFLRGSVAVSVLFAAAHGSLGSIVPAFVSGMLLAWLYKRTGSLWNSCIAHAAQNALAFATSA